VGLGKRGSDVLLENYLFLFSLRNEKFIEGVYTYYDNFIGRMYTYELLEDLSKA
jgi:hypothetical protein